MFSEYQNPQQTDIMKNIGKYSMFLIGLMALLILGFSSCRKERNEEADMDTAALVEYAIADAAFSDVAGIAEEAYDGNLQSYRNSSNTGSTLSNCASIVFDTTTSPKTLTIDFGPNNCLCSDGNYRKGKIIVSWIGAYRDSGSVHTITFDNYFVNYNQIGGTKTVTNNGTNAAGHPVYSVTVNGFINWDPQYISGGGTSTMVSTRTREWVAGYNTPGWLDDIYHISGTAGGNTRTGVSYTMNTTSPLVKEIGFRHFTAGVLQFTPGSRPTRTIDYGYVNGQRDNLAQVTINGQSFTITLK